MSSNIIPPVSEMSFNQENLWFFFAQNWTIQETMIEWNFAPSDLTISVRYFHVGYKGIWVYEKIFSGTIESPGTKFNCTQSKDLDALIQAFPML